MHKIPRAFCLLIVAATLLGVGACSNKPRTPSRYRTGLNGGAQVSTLDDNQLAQICESYDVYVNTVVDLDQVAYIACLPAAMFTTLTPQACEESLKNCMALFPAPIKVSAKADNTRVCAQTLKQCRANVGDLEGCVTVNVERALSIADIWSCDLVNDPRYRDMASSNGLVNVCANVDGACNGFAAIQAPQ